MTNKAYVEFYIDWYCMFYDIYEYEVNFGSGLYGDFRKEFQPYFHMIRNDGEHTSFFGVNKEQSEERVKKIKNNTNHCLYELYHMLKGKKYMIYYLTQKNILLNSKVTNQAIVIEYYMI
ncbi:hypothetical protein BUZ84_09440 [Mammaliicoccus sciuri]|uniref:hypothetical protein n=1 Tax=Mammaliicoccus sciuri TaxID=1296 RepID=UPI000D1F4E5E|nr:hypothetical protein [Mammaliicoccus sciuri]PTJ80483.1 hypothetical protein BUZ84_09440 [Mammaliicoccus sciuri]